MSLKTNNRLKRIIEFNNDAITQTGYADSDRTHLEDGLQLKLAVKQLAIEFAG